MQNLTIRNENNSIYKGMQIKSPSEASNGCILFMFSIGNRENGTSKMIVSKEFKSLQMMIMFRGKLYEVISWNLLPKLFFV